MPSYHAIGRHSIMPKSEGASKWAIYGRTLVKLFVWQLADAHIRAKGIK